MRNAKENQMPRHSTLHIGGAGEVRLVAREGLIPRVVEPPSGWQVGERASTRLDVGASVSPFGGQPSSGGLHCGAHGARSCRLVARGAWCHGTGECPDRSRLRLRAPNSRVERFVTV
jgi:hypothetical protein